MRIFTSHRSVLFLLALFVTMFCIVPAQSVKELEAQRKQMLKNLEATNRLLNETKKSKTNSIKKLTIISKNIVDRKVLIKNINSEIGLLDNKITQLDQEKNSLESRLKSLKSDYAKLVQDGSANRSVYNKFMFIMSAESFEQSLRRLRYTKEYSDYRVNQVNDIQKVTAQIIQKNDSLSDHKFSKIEVVKIKEDEAQNLTRDQMREKELLSDLQREEKKLRTELAIQQKRANDLNNRIENIIAEEIRKAEARKAAERKRLEAEHQAKQAAAAAAAQARQQAESKTGTRIKPTAPAPVATPAPVVSAQTKEENLLTGNFERNAGRLPWPVANGYISGHFGVQPHPMLRHVTTNNKGIYIQSPANSTARAVYDGIVTQRFSIPGSNNAVIIKHGNFRTVYANLTQIFVGEGDKVSTKQAIGKIYTDDENEHKTELYFQIWRDKVLINPESWITR